MKTIIYTSKDLSSAARQIAEGNVIAFPTETVYGVGANALDPAAIRKIFRAKMRPADNPLIVHVTGSKQAEKLAYLNDTARMMMRSFWPGPLTIIRPKKAIIPKEVTASLDTVALRMPKNSIALNLIRLSGVPIAAPSANLSGKPSGTSFEHVYEDLKGKIAGIIRSEDSHIGLESTVVDLTASVPLVLRPGAITLEQLRAVVPKIKVHSSRSEKPRSPGMKYRHYSPDAKVILFEDPGKIGTYRKNAEADGKSVVVLPMTDPVSASKDLFKRFRELDKLKVDEILIPACSEEGIGLALMNRLRKSASTIIR